MKVTIDSDVLAYAFIEPGSFERVLSGEGRKNWCENRVEICKKNMLN
ncbi:MAG: hypothetical protein Q8N79_07425 [Candidatus Methanoperedens sp.]|nr:hypothetical protein [Candidatus Methanoperedens sp.]